jgi:hypothetical protein
MVEASGSPLAPPRGHPALTTSSGRTPNSSGRHSTQSASRPGVSAPDVVPQAVRDRRVRRDLRQVAQHAGVVARAALPTPRAPHHVGVLEGAAQHLPRPAHALRVAREHVDDPEVVQHALGGHRRRAHPGADGGQVAVHHARFEHVHRRDHRLVLGHRCPIPKGTVGAVELVSTCGRPAQAQQVGRVAAAGALDVEGVHGAPGERPSVPSTDSTSFRPSVWIASCTSKRSQTSSAVRIWAGPAPTSSWIFSPPPPARSPSSSGPGREALPRTSSATFERHRLQRGPRRPRPPPGSCPGSTPARSPG